MESGGRPNRRCKSTNRTSAPGIVIGTTVSRGPYDDNRSSRQTAKQRDQHFHIPKIAEIMHLILPAHVNIDEDAKKAMEACISKFISFITTEANKQCHQDSRNTITPTDVLLAMSTLGFDNYIEPMNAYLSNFHAQDLEHSSVHHGSFVTHTMSRNMQEPVTKMARPPLPPTCAINYDPTQQSTSQLFQPPPQPSIIANWLTNLKSPQPAPDQSLTLGYHPTQLLAPKLAPQPSITSNFHPTVSSAIQLAPQSLLTLDYNPTELPADVRNYVEFVNNYFMNKQDGGESYSKGGGEGSSRGRGD